MSVNLMSAIFEVEFFDLKNAQGEVTKASTAKLVLLAMADHANDEGEGAYPSITRLARKTALSEQTIRNTFECLRHNGIISLEGLSKHGTNNHTINTNCFPKAIGKEVTVLTLKSVAPSNEYSNPSNGDKSLTYSFDPNHITIHKTSDENFPKKPAIKGIEASIYEGRPTTQEDIDPAKVEYLALIAFETSFGVNTKKGQILHWYARKPEWTKLRKFVVELYQNDSQCFEKYKVWRKTPYVSGAVSLKGVQSNPLSFMASWVAFTEATQPQNKEVKNYTDTKGIPLT